jgi:hypothetical protein
MKMEVSIGKINELMSKSCDEMARLQDLNADLLMVLELAIECGFKGKGICPDCRMIATKVIKKAKDSTGG